MRRSTGAYLGALLLSVLVWLWISAASIARTGESLDWSGLLGISALYLCSHLFRMMRLGLLTLDDHKRAFPLIAAHTLTAFPSSFLPFKIGEALRLTAFFHVYDRKQKALAIWIAERFGDVLVITLFILGLYLLKLRVPPAMHAVFIFFLVAGSTGILGMFAIANIFIYLNRHLVLASHSKRGLALLRISHSLRQLETSIYRSVEGRLCGFILLSLLVWVVEILALSMFIRQFGIGSDDWGALFSAVLLESLPGGEKVTANFGLYQSLALVALTLAFLAFAWTASRIRSLKA